MPLSPEQDAAEEAKRNEHADPVVDGLFDDAIRRAPRDQDGGKRVHVADRQVHAALGGAPVTWALTLAAIRRAVERYRAAGWVVARQSDQRDGDFTTLTTPSPKGS